MRTRVFLGATSLLFVLACASAPPPPPEGAPYVPPVAGTGGSPPAPAAPAPTPSVVAAPPPSQNGDIQRDGEPPPSPLQVASEGSPVPLRADLAALRAQGIAAMDAGRYADARAAFAAVLRDAPGDLTTASLLQTAEKALTNSQARAAVDLSRIAPIVLPKPPFAAFVGKGVQVTDRRPLRLRKRSEKRNAITDDDRWFRDNGLRFPGLDVPRGGSKGSLPESLPTRYGDQKLVGGVTQSTGTVLLFGPDFSGGRYVVLLDTAGHATQVLDFAAFGSAPTVVPGDEAFVHQGVQWAEVHDGVLYVATGHNTYAKSSGGKNAFLSAIDKTTGELLWQSAPLVSNAANFVVVGGHIVCGYGFTAEPDFLFVVDRANGKTESRVPVASGPSVLVPKDGELYVRTYDMDYVFALE